MIWNRDISQAPQDRRLWLATKCEKVCVSRWNEKRGAWDGLATGEEPLAWQLYVVPTHPHFESDGGAVAEVKANGRLADHTRVEPPLSDRQYVEKIADRVIAERADGGLNIVTKHIFEDVGSGA
ncbi:hypothetical protein [Rhizobium rhizogenes]|uniref:hypothetical protein n=1 Tax=Rhizobium rhizogenes TaxID=359 RepID=UPI00157168DC|nr:hypothetical protein [Rhizobium rhizogenes]NTG07117.1 hypothetical protein [Rhizobium rhizogenes]